MSSGAILRRLPLAALLLYIATLTLFPITNNDLWIHLKTGELVLSQGDVPDKDPYSFVAADRDYVAHEWLAAVLFHLVHSAAGTQGLILLKLLLVSGTCLALHGAARALGARTGSTLAAFLCVLYISSARFLVRPHLFSYLLTAIYLLLFLSYRRRGRGRAWLLAFPALQMLWANLHGGHLIGLALVSVFAVGETLSWCRERLGGGAGSAGPTGRQASTLWLLLLACVLASMATPYGYRLLLFPFQLTGMSLFMEGIYEWAPPYHASYNRSTMFGLYVAQLAWLCGALFLARPATPAAGRAGSRLRWLNTGMAGSAVALAALALLFLYVTPAVGPSMAEAEEIRTRNLLIGIVALVALHAAANLRTADFTGTGLILLLCLMSLRHNRAVTDAALGTLPFLAASTSLALHRLRRAREADAEGRTTRTRPALSVPALAGSLLLVSLSCWTLYSAYYYDFAGSGREKGLGVSRTMPVCATEFVERQGIGGNAFVSYSEAGLLIHRTFPAVKVGMDSRNDVYGEELYGEYREALRDPDRMSDYLARHHVDLFLLAYRSVEMPVIRSLLESGDWAPVHFDDRAFVLLRRGAGYDTIIRREEYQALRPGGIAEMTVTPANALRVLQEANRAVDACKASIVGRFWASKALQALGRLEEAVATNREILEIDPRHHRAMTEIGNIYAVLGRNEEAREMYREALEVEPGYWVARENLRRLSPQ